MVPVVRALRNWPGRKLEQARVVSQPLPGPESPGSLPDRFPEDGTSIDSGNSIGCPCYLRQSDVALEARALSGGCYCSPNGAPCADGGAGSSRWLPMVVVKPL